MGKSGLGFFYFEIEHAPSDLLLPSTAQKGKAYQLFFFKIEFIWQKGALIREEGSNREAKADLYSKDRIF